jgi:hypothetical protein
VPWIQASFVLFSFTFGARVVDADSPMADEILRHSHPDGTFTTEGAFLSILRCFAAHDDHHRVAQQVKSEQDTLRNLLSINNAPVAQLDRAAVS